MDINELIAIVKKKLTEQINIDSVEVEDKSFCYFQSYPIFLILQIL